LNWLDILIALSITIPTFYGFRRGFLRKFLGIAGIIVGFILAVRFYEPVSGFFNKLFSTDLLVVQVMSFLFIIALIYGITVWLAGLLAGMNAGTSLLDKFAGTIFGFIQGVIIASVLLFNLAYIDLPDKKVRESSLLYDRVLNVAPMIFDKVISFSPDLKKIYEEYKQKFIPSK